MRPLVKRSAFVIFAITIAIIVPQARAEEMVKLVYAMPITVPAVIPYIALDKGFFKEEGLDVEAKMFSSGREALQALLTKRAQVQSVSETPVVHAIIQGNEIVTVATVAEHIEAKLLARKDHGIKQPADLRGKRVATLPGTNSDYFMHMFLNKYRIGLDQVKIVNMPPPEMVVAFVNGNIDAYFAWEPHIFYGKKRLPKESIVFYPEELYRGRTTVNMNPDFVREHPEVVRKLIRGFLKAEDFVRQHPEEAIDLVSQRLKIDKDVLRGLWEEHVFKVQLDREFLVLLQDIGRWALEQSKSKKALPDFNRYIYTDALHKERPSRVELKYGG